MTKEVKVKILPVLEQARDHDGDYLPESGPSPHPACEVAVDLGLFTKVKIECGGLLAHYYRLTASGYQFLYDQKHPVRAFWRKNITTVLLGVTAIATVTTAVVTVVNLLT